MTIPNIFSGYLSSLDQLRSIALEGLKYARNSYDTERYNKLLDIVSNTYSDISGESIIALKQHFYKEIGIITPKLGVNVALTNTNNEILILQRSDDHLWCLPGGWVDIGENLARTAIRETKEETGLDVESLYCISIQHKGPHTFSHIQHQINILIFMKPISPGVRVKLSHEHLEYKWINSNKNIMWHPGHDKEIQETIRFINSDRNKFIDIECL